MRRTLVIVGIVVVVLLVVVYIVRRRRALPGNAPAPEPTPSAVDTAGPSSAVPFAPGGGEAGVQGRGGEI